MSNPYYRDYGKFSRIAKRTSDNFTLSYICKESVKFYYMLVAMFNFGTVGQKRKFEKWRRNNLSKKWI